MMLAQRVFNQSDQIRFASVSGDYNPMHVDALKARRTQAGAPVVHGIHLLLWAFDSLAAAQPELPPLRGFRAQFNKFVYLDEYAQVELIKQGPTSARLAISVDNAPRSKVTIDFGDAVGVCPSWPSASLDRILFSHVPLNLDFEEMCGRSGRLLFQMSAEDAVMMFPSAARWLGAQRIAALAASTYLVGMTCPGLHSIYSELSLTTCTDSDSEGSLAFRVTDTDARFRSVDQEIAGGGLTGVVKSFARIPPVQQASMESLNGVVGQGEFAGSVALIVGGSRGLGELTAKLIAAGGGSVIVTWQSGKDDAERVAQEIRSAGGSCETFGYDARKPAAEQLASLAIAPTHAYYFATPAIFRPQGEIFVGERLCDFLAVYVNGFWQLLQALRARQPRVSLFYPSSVFVAERPRGMTEYSMAKAAGEILCADINESLSPLHVTVSRLPRLPTDQTVSVTSAETANPMDTMLPIVKEVQSWPR
ncbi:MAG: SDR family NAD(P)-dependent oxidoreductase [Terracidiphilus sp.]|nr:SDR family NAD(P)-dependent oxidoreductase [Terracidiphilus sp.]